MKFLERFWWLRFGAIWFHLSLFLRVRLEPAFIYIRTTRAKMPSDEAYRLVATKLLALAAEMERRPVPAKDAYMLPFRLWLRFGHYALIAWFLTVLPEEMRGRLPVEAAKQVVHYCELAIALYQDGAKDYVTERAKRSKRTPPNVRQYRALASIYRLLASTYLALHPNDAAYDCATAFDHLRSAAGYLEGINHPQGRWDAAEILCELGESYLAHPYEVDSTENARKALQRAKELVVPDLGAVKPPPEEMRNHNEWKQMSNSVRFRKSMMYASDLQRGRRRVESGINDPTYAWSRVAPLMYKIDCQLGAVYRKQSNLAASIECFTAALTDFTQDRDQSAYVNCEIGYTYLECGRPRNKEDLNLAIRYFDKVIELQGKTKFVKPLIRALIGNAYAIVGLTEIAVDAERTKMMPKLEVMAKNLHIAMIEARKRNATDLCQEAAYVLGLVHMNKRQYAHAYKAFALSSRLLDRLQRSSRTLRLKRYRISTSVDLYNNLIFVAMRYKRTQGPDAIPPKFATEYVKGGFLFTFSERGRAVFLREEIANRCVVPQGADSEMMRDFIALRRLWHQADMDLQTKERTLATESAIIALTKRRDEFEDRYFKALREIRETYNDPDYDPDMPIAPMRFSQLESTINRLAKAETTALVEYHVSHSRITVLILLPSCRGFGNQVYWKEVILDCEDVGQTIQGWGTQRAGSGSTSDFETEGYYRNWLLWGKGHLLQTLDRLSELAEYPSSVIAEWEKRTGAKVKRVILVPHKFLHLVPLHAIRLRSGAIWGDTVAIQYVPSASVLYHLIDSSAAADPTTQHSPRQNVVVIAGQSDNRSFEREAATVSRILDGVAVCGMEREIGEIVQLIADADYIHFACHGKYDHASPMGGGLQYAREGDRASGRNPSREQPAAQGWLTLGEIFERVHLSRAPIVVLSACESGISKIEQSHDEYIGLPAGFLYAGAQTVVSSLWRVADPAVELLMRRMTEHLARGERISEALRIAQQWLRTLQRDAAMVEIAAMLQTKESSPVTDEMENVLQEFPILRIAEAYPFANPYWWAGFTINGLG
jgi:CHAT domain-containing protein/tetratricopeptide (TPR) repeat protein